MVLVLKADMPLNKEIKLNPTRYIILPAILEVSVAELQGEAGEDLKFDDIIFKRTMIKHNG